MALSSALPVFPLGIETGFGLVPSRQGANFRLDLERTALRTTGSGNDYRVDAGGRIKEVRGGLELLIQADRSNTGPAYLIVDGFTRWPLLDAGGAPHLADRIVEGRFYSVLFSEADQAFRLQAGASTLDEIPGLIDLRSDVAQNAATTQADRQAVEISTGLVEAARSEVAESRQAVAGDLTASNALRAAVSADRDAVQSDRSATQTFRDQAQAAIGTNRVLKDTLAELTASLGYPEGTIGEVVNDPAEPTATVGNGYYAKVGPVGSGSWQKKADATVPGLAASVAAINQVQSIPGGAYGHVVTDLKGYAGSYTYGDQNRVLPGSAYQSAMLDRDGYAGSFVQPAPRMPGSFYADVITDLDGYAGEVRRLDGRPIRVLPQFDTSLIHIIGFGQSPSRGAIGTTPLTTTPPLRTFSFNGGDRADDGPGTVAQNHASLIGFVATVKGAEGETPNGGAAIALAQLMAADGVGLVSQQQSLLMSAPGQSGAAIEDLSKGSAAFERLKADITYGYAAAVARGETYSMPAYLFTGGETNIERRTPREEYKRLHRQLRTDIELHRASVVSRAERLVCVLNQVGTHDWYGQPPTIALAQLDLATEENSDFVAGAPFYLTSYVGDVHGDAFSLKRIGAYDGKALDHLRQGKLFKPLHPIRAEAQGNVLLVKFHVPVAPLVIDTSEVTDPNGARGFEIFDPATGANIAITGVRVAGRDTVELRAASPVPPGARVRYAYTPPAGFVPGGDLRKNTGARGCLRDSDPFVFEPSGMNLPLPNYCWIFDLGVE